jgi:DNA-binding NtrC family response regulator
MTAAIAPSTFSATSVAEGPALLNLLIVDDERAVREACREAASALGYRTTAAESAEHALRVIDAHNIDVILLDLKLPGAGGLEVLRQLKSVRPDIEIVVVTGHGTVESAVQAMKAGAYDYMTKPFSLEELRHLLARVASHLKPRTVYCAKRSGPSKA